MNRKESFNSVNDIEKPMLEQDNKLESKYIESSKEIQIYVTLSDFRTVVDRLCEITVCSFAFVLVRCFLFSGMVHLRITYSY